MNTLFFKQKLFYLLALAGLALVSCNKNTSGLVNSSSTTSSTSRTITVGVDSVSGDSIYVVQPCPWGYTRDSIAASALPTTITNYLDSNYAGYSFTKAFSIQNSAGTIAGYVVIVQYNGKPVGLLFDANGNLVQVLEQIEAGDNSQGWHWGGRYCNRNGSQGDTVALTALPSSITDYYSSNYPNDTLVRAYKNFDSSYLVISVDSAVYASIFSASGSFVKRVELSNPPAHNQETVQSVAQDSLPSTALSYLSSTYPNYVFDKAFSVTTNGTLQGYVVVIDANSTKYAVYFDASGNYKGTRSIW